MHGSPPINNIDPVVAFTVEMYEIRRYERKCRGILINALRCPKL